MLTSYISLSVKVDWDNDGSYSQAGDDVSADCRYPVSTSRGRSSATDQPKAGTGSFRLRNGEGTYTPFNMSSPLYPNVIGGRPVTIVATYGGVDYPIFVGRCSPDSGRFAPDGDLTFTMIDAFEEFRKGTTSTALLQDVRVDEIIGQVLDDIGWPATARVLFRGADTLGVFANAAYKENPLATMQMAARQELGGMLLMDREGNVMFQSRDYPAIQAPLATLTGTFDDLVPSLRQEDLVDRVRGAYARYVVETELSAVYTLSASGRPIYPGLDVRNKFEGTFNGAGATGAIEPISVMDYSANSAFDGSGTDKTSAVTVESLEASSRGFTIWFRNSDTNTAYLVGSPALQIRGYAISGATEDNMVDVDVVAPVLTGQTLEVRYEWNDDGNAVSGWVNYQSTVRGEMQPRVTLQITPDTDALMALVLSADIGDRITLSDVAAPWLTQITGDWFIEAIDLEISGAGEATAIWTLFSSDMVGGSMAAMSSDLDAIGRKLMFVGDFSVMATDTATTGAKMGY